MNPMSGLLFACLIAWALLLAGCNSQPIELSGKARVSPSTQTTSESGVAYKLGDDSDFMHADSTDDSGGLSMKPGDVLYIRRWSAGTTTNAKNRAYPTHDTDRIPLRHVAIGGRLFEYEREFLLNVLNCNRHPKGTSSDPELPEKARAAEIQIWNAIVDSIRLKRLGGNIAAGGKTVPFSLVVTVSLADIAAKLKADGYFKDSPAVKLGDVSIDGIETPYNYPHEVLFGTQQKRKNNNYYDLDPGRDSNLFTFVTAELDGVDIRQPGVEESQWTLRDLQESGMCRQEDTKSNVMPSIAAITLPNSSKRLWFDDSKAATYEVKNVFTEKRYSRTLVPRGHPPLLGAYTLAKSALDQILVTDVIEVVWQVGTEVAQVSTRCNRVGGRK